MPDQLEAVDVLSVTEHMVLCRRAHESGSHSPESYGTWIPWKQLRAFSRENEAVYASVLKEAHRQADLKAMRRWAIQAPPFASNLYIGKDQAEIALPSIVKLWRSALVENGKDVSLSASIVAIDPDEIFTWRSKGGSADDGDRDTSRDR
jgi:hypothetical protein